MTNPMTDHGAMNADQMAHMHHAGTTQAQPSLVEPCDPNDPDADNRPPTCGVHNQMMVGTQTIYLSHLPMFMFDARHHEHNFQVILEVTFSGPGNPQATYVNDCRSHPNERMYTMSPAAFEMIELDPQHPRRQELRGRIFRGHLERAGHEVIIKDAVAHVTNTVYFHEFEESAKPLPQLTYLLFGKGAELFLAHVINAPPDFDQILGVTVNGHSFTDEDLHRGIRITIPGRANTPHTRLKAREQVTGQIQPDGAQATPPLALQLKAGTEFYFEEGELRAPRSMTFDSTPEEKVAGF